MIPRLTIKGDREAFALLQGVAERAADPSPAWDAVADDVFRFQRGFWLLGGNWRRKTDKDKRAGRDPRYMIDTGGLMRAVTQRGAPGQKITAAPTFLLLEITHGLAKIHEARGRQVLGEPGQQEAGRYARRVHDYILTGRL